MTGPTQSNHFCPTCLNMSVGYIQGAEDLVEQNIMRAVELEPVSTDIWLRRKTVSWNFDF